MPSGEARTAARPNELEISRSLTKADLAAGIDDVGRHTTLPVLEQREQLAVDIGRRDGESADEPAAVPALFREPLEDLEQHRYRPGAGAVEIAEQ